MSDNDCAKATHGKYIFTIEVGGDNLESLIRGAEHFLEAAKINEFNVTAPYGNSRIRKSVKDIQEIPAT